MKTSELIRLSMDIITEYYKNNLEPYFGHISDEIFWLGPAERQILQGKKNIIKAWSAEKHGLSFTIGDIKAVCIAPGSRVREILLHYMVFTHYPSGNTFVHDQRLHFTWQERSVKTAAGRSSRSEIVMIHISNAWKYDEQDTIYPVHYENVSVSERPSPVPEQYITVKATDQSTHRIAVSHILCVETVKRSARLLLHTMNGSISVYGTLSEFEKKHPGLFLRIHTGYLINPAHVRSIRRFRVILSDGSEFPVPEKKYTHIKKLLLEENEER